MKALTLLSEKSLDTRHQESSKISAKRVAKPKKHQRSPPVDDELPGDSDVPVMAQEDIAQCKMVPKSVTFADPEVTPISRKYASLPTPQTFSSPIQKESKQEYSKRCK